MASEKNFENKIKQFLQDEGCWFIKYWSGSSSSGKTFTKEGIPDILCCCNGYFVGIEVKAPNGKPSLLQLHNLKKIDQAGGYGILLYPIDFDLFKNFVDCIIQGDMENARYNYKILKGRWWNDGEIEK